MENLRNCVPHKGYNKQNKLKAEIILHRPVSRASSSKFFSFFDKCDKLVLGSKRKTLTHKVCSMIKKIILYSFLLALLLLQATGVAFSQPKAVEEKVPDIRFGKITFQAREFESGTPPLRMLEVQVEILNKSRKIIAPSNSIRVVVVPKEIIFPEGTSVAEFNPTQEEITVPVPLSPNTGRMVIFGFSLPEKKPESITFEVQINPPGGENSVVKWQSGD
jgi:hypothetical protein